MSATAEAPTTVGQPYQPVEVVKTTAGDVREGDVLSHGGDEKRVVGAEPSQSGTTTRITFEDGTSYAPRASKQLAVQRQVDEQPEGNGDESPAFSERVALALSEHGGALATDLTPEQRARALDADKKKSGLGGKALADWIMTGQSPSRAAANAPKAKRTSSKAGTSRKSQYPDDVRARVRRAYDIMGTGHAPGPKQHLAVEKAIGNDDPLKATGFTSLKALTAFAKGEGGKLTAQTDHVRQSMRALWDKAGQDPFARGKHLACIVVALVEQRKAGAK